MRSVHLVAVGLLLASCGTANINRLFGTEDDSYASLLQRAQYAYDEGDFSKAEELAAKAYDRAENNGDAGILLGNIYLSQAGIDIFQLVGKLSTLSSGTSSSDPEASKCKTAPTTGQPQSSSNVLGELSCLLLSLTDADKSALGSTITTADPEPYSGLKAIGVPTVYIPNEVNEALRGNVAILGALDKGIKALCPFINRASVLDKSLDERHKPTACVDRTSTSFSSAKAHISFALLHLVEALVFQQGVLIDGAGSADASRTGLKGISSKIASHPQTDVLNLAKASFDLATVVGQVFDADNPKSQIALALNGLIMVSQSFEIAGVPSSVTKVITGQLTNIQQTAAKLPGGDSPTNQTQALAGQISQVYAKQMADTINRACPNQDACTPEQEAQFCQGFNSISAGLDPSSIQRPTVCPAPSSI